MKTNKEVEQNKQYKQQASVIYKAIRVRTQRGRVDENNVQGMKHAQAN